MAKNIVASKPVVKTVKAANTASTGTVPTLVKVIAVLYYIGAAFSVLFGILLIAGGAFLGELLSTAMGGGFGALAGALGSAIFIVSGIIMIALAVLSFFIARGLWKAKKWARIVAIIFAILGVLSALSAIIQGNFGNIIGLVINGAIGGYLLFSKDVKAAFA